MQLMMEDHVQTISKSVGCLEKDHFRMTLQAGTASISKQIPKVMKKNVLLLGNDGRKTFSLTSEIPTKPKSNELNFKESEVLPGKGGLSNNHPGNIRYRALVQERRAMYQDTSTSIAVKRSLSTEIVDHILLMGGRFLIEKNIDNVCRYH
jgi:hypothetical protein